MLDRIKKWYFSYEGRTVYIHGPVMRGLVTAYIILAIACSWGLIMAMNAADDGKKAREALCALQFDLIDRVEAQRELVERGDLTKAQEEILRQSIRNQDRTLHAIAPLLGRCPEDVRP